MEHKDNIEDNQKQSMLKGNLTKLLPAAAVITAVAIAAAQPEYDSTAKNEQASEKEIIKSDELKSLLTTAYYTETEGTEKETKSLTSKKNTKKKKAGIIIGKTKALPQKTAASSGVGQGSTYTPTAEVPKDGYKDGTYQGSGTGFGGTITVQVTVSGGKIASIDILSASAETPSYFAAAKGVISRMISGQTPNVDAVSGATYSSNGIIEAVQNALAKAGNKKSNKKNNKKEDKKNEKKDPTPTITPRPTAAPRPTITPGDETITSYYKDGVYSAKARGYSGFITVTITIKDKKIVDITNENTDTPSFFRKAWKNIQPAILEKQSVNGVDAVTGATFSSNGILEAVEKALEEAWVSEVVKPSTTPTPTIIPEPTVTPELTPTPEVTPTPGPTESPEVSPTPGPTETPEVSPTPGPTETPEVTPTPEPPEIPVSGYADGTFTGSGAGNYGAGSVTVTVTISGGKIVGATYVTDDDEEFFMDAWESILAQVLASQSADVDTVSGATYSSEGIIQAFGSALSQAKQ